MKIDLSHSGSIILLTLFAAASGAGRGAEARDLELKPTIAVGEEYSDNVRETATDRKTEFTTRVRPGVLLGYRTPWLVWDSAYNFEYRHYAKGSHGDEQLHSLDLKANAELVQGFLYLDLSDGLHRTTIDVGRDVETESLLTNQTTRNLASVSPYFLWRPSESAVIKTGYRFVDTRYWDGSGIDRQENGGFIDFEDQLSAKTTLYASYTFTRGDSRVTGYNRNDASGGFKYLYADNSFIFARVGNSWQSFSGGTSRSNLFWDAGVTHDFRLLTATLETKVQNTEDPLSVSTRQTTYTGSIDKTFDRGAIGLRATYAEYLIIETDNLDERRLSIAATGRYDIRPRLSLSGNVTGDRFRVNSSGEYPYRFMAGAAVNYGFLNDNTALSLSYTYRTDRMEIDSGRDEKVTNRVLLEIRAGL